MSQPDKTVKNLTQVMHKPWIRHGSIVLMGAFIISSIQRFWVHPSGGHTFRQADTIGMCIAFAEDLKTRGLAGLDFILYPRLLEKGLRDGINATEFPLLDVLGGFFFLGGNPWVGVFFTSLFVLLLNIWVAYTYLPRFLLAAWQVRISGLLGLVFWFCNASIAQQSNIIMPEGIAFPLMIMGMAYLAECANDEKALSIRTKKSPGVSFAPFSDLTIPYAQLTFGVILCSLGIAVKPTMAIALGSILVSLLFFQRRTPTSMAVFFIALLSLVFPGWWFTTHARYILSVAQGPQIVPLAQLDALGKLRETGWANGFHLLTREMTEDQFPMYLGWIFILLGIKFREWLLTLFYFVALVGVICLDGPHTGPHGYYYMGAAAFALPLMARVLSRSLPSPKNAQERPSSSEKSHPSKTSQTQPKKKLAWQEPTPFILILVLFWGLLYTTRTNIWTWARDSHLWQLDFWAMGTEARKIIPPTDHLITDDGGYPQKLLFVGRSGTKMNTYPYEICNRDEFRHLSLSFVVDTAPPPLNDRICRGRRRQTSVIQNSYARWYVTSMTPIMPDAKP
jgi:hypothetical protein